MTFRGVQTFRQKPSERMRHPRTLEVGAAFRAAEVTPHPARDGW
jgi:hypothetical protein